MRHPARFGCLILLPLALAGCDGRAASNEPTDSLHANGGGHAVAKLGSQVPELVEIDEHESHEPIPEVAWAKPTDTLTTAEVCACSVSDSCSCGTDRCVCPHCEETGHCHPKETPAPELAKTKPAATTKKAAPQKDVSYPGWHLETVRECNGGSCRYVKRWVRDEPARTVKRTYRTQRRGLFRRQ